MKRTATHYDVLGVEPTASHDEVKRAYTERALKYHPDRQAPEDAEARARAEFHMREVNAAWAVLRSPARRAEYDARLRGDTPVWGQQARPRRTSPVTAQVADLRPQATTPGTVADRGVRVGPIVVIAVVLVVAALALAAWATTSSSGSGGDVEVQTGTSFETGSCVVLAAVGGRITPVPVVCGSTGAMQIVQVVDLGRPCSAPAQSFDEQSDQVRLCLVPSSP